jgi:hypothetical protein
VTFDVLDAESATGATGPDETPAISVAEEDPPAWSMISAADAPGSMAATDISSRGRIVCGLSLVTVWISFGAGKRGSGALTG